MQRERVAESIYVFTSDRYLQVTAGVIVTPQGCVVIDTLPFPSESRELLAFARRVCKRGIRYVVNTHYHADHTFGNCFFKGIPLIGHELTRRTLEKIGDSALKEAQAEDAELAEVSVCVPDITYKGKATIRLGNFTIELIEAPGNSADGTMVYINEEKVLFAGDAMLPVPYIVSGDVDALLDTLAKMRGMSIESLVQGHGDVLLRGEIPESIDAAVAYLKRLRQYVQKAKEQGLSERDLLRWDIESAGLSRIPLGGLVQDLHRANLLALFRGQPAQAAAA
jgi:cyclase